MKVTAVLCCHKNLLPDQALKRCRVGSLKMDVLQLFLIEVVQLLVHVLQTRCERWLGPPVDATMEMMASSGSKFRLRSASAGLVVALSDCYPLTGT